MQSRGTGTHMEQREDIRTRHRKQRPLMSLRNAAGIFDLRQLASFDSWRNLAVHFSLCSLVGRWIEVPWCIFCLYAFNIYDPNSLVWGDPFYPFCVYGVGAIVCGVFLTPLMDLMLTRRKTIWGAVLEFYVLCVFVSMVMEVGMGLMLNQPDANGVYPLWNNAVLPFNVLNQAWIPNDLLLGAAALVYTWIFYPLTEVIMGAVPRRIMNVVAAIIVVGFILLCCHEFWALF